MVTARMVALLGESEDAAPDRRKLLGTLRTALKAIAASDKNTRRMTVSAMKEDGGAIDGFRIVYDHLGTAQKEKVLDLLKQHGLVPWRVDPIGGRFDWSYEVLAMFAADGWTSKRTDLP